MGSGKRCFDSNLKSPAADDRLKLVCMNTSYDHNEKKILSELSLASIRGEELKVYELLKNSVDLNSKSHCNTALFDAIRYEHPSIVRILLVHGANVNRTNPDDDLSPIETAFEHPNQEIIEALVKSGANIGTISPTAIARVSDSPETFIILKNIGADLNAQDPESKRTALHESSMYGYLNTVKLLIKYGADITIKDRWGNTAYDLALKNQHLTLIELLSAAEPDAYWCKTP